MTPLRFTDIYQSAVLPAAERFHLALGFAGPDPRSIKNLCEIRDRADHCLVFTMHDHDTDELVMHPNALKVRLNLAKVRNCEHHAWDDESSAEVLAERLSEQVDGAFRVLVDVSAFPRRMLAVILDAVREAVAGGLSVRLTLAYRLAVFSRPSDRPAPPNRRVAPVHPNVAGWPRRPGLPVHLIVGLGYERGKALGAVEYIQPAHLTLFYPESPVEEFAKQVGDRNRELLEGDETAVFHYPVMDPATQVAMLSSMLQAMLSDSKPVLLPFGPKIFFAVCLLVSFRFSEVAVWHVSGEEDEAKTPIRPSTHVTYASFFLEPGVSTALSSPRPDAGT